MFAAFGQKFLHTRVKLVGNETSTAFARDGRARVHRANLDKGAGTHKRTISTSVRLPSFDQIGGNSIICTAIEPNSCEAPPEVEDIITMVIYAATPYIHVRLTVQRLYRLNRGRKNLGKTHTP